MFCSQPWSSSRTHHLLKSPANLKDVLDEAKSLAQRDQESEAFEGDPQQCRPRLVSERCRVSQLGCVSARFFSVGVQGCTSSFYNDLHHLLVVQFARASSCFQLPVQGRGPAVCQNGTLAVIIWRFLPNRQELGKHRRSVLFESRSTAAVRRLNHLLRL